MQRLVQPEWLDELPAGDPRAVRSRRDLRRVNAWMGHTVIMARALRAQGAATPRRVLDLGAGDGTFMLRLARRMRWRGSAAVLVDRQDIVTEATRAQFAALGWTVETAAADVFDYLARTRRPAADAIVCNLFLHHFDDRQLARLLAVAAHCAPLFVACEPRRGALARAGSRFLWAIGCNDVSRHDAAVSVAAGFCGGEVSALWPARAGWSLRERAAGLFTHCFVAARTEAA